MAKIWFGRQALVVVPFRLAVDNIKKITALVEPKTLVEDSRALLGVLAYRRRLSSSNSRSQPSSSAAHCTKAR